MVRYDYTDTKKIMVFIGLQVSLQYLFTLCTPNLSPFFHFQAPICEIKCLASKKSIATFKKRCKMTSDEKFLEMDSERRIS